MNDLFQPSLREGAEARALYSSQATFLTSFFGGPPAAVMILGENSRRMGTLVRDGAILALGLAAWVGLYWYYLTGPGAETGGPRSIRFGARAIALVTWGAVSWLHQSSQRASDLMGVERPNGWGLGLGSVLVGAGASMLLQAALRIADGGEI